MPQHATDRETFAVFPTLDHFEVTLERPEHCGSIALCDASPSLSVFFSAVSEELFCMMVKQIFGHLSANFLKAGYLGACFGGHISYVGSHERLR